MITTLVVVQMEGKGMTMESIEWTDVIASGLWSFAQLL